MERTRGEREREREAHERVEGTDGGMISWPAERRWRCSDIWWLQQEASACETRLSFQRKEKARWYCCMAAGVKTTLSGASMA